MSEQAGEPVIADNSAGVAEIVAGVQAGNIAVGEAKAETHWTSSFKDAELAKSPSLQKIKDVESLAKSYTELEKFRGNSISLPKDENDAEGWAKIHRKLGVPESVEGYTVKERDFHGQKISKETMKDYIDAAHKAGMTQKQLDASIDSDFARYSKTYEDAIKKRDAGIAERKDSIVKEFGDKYESLDKSINNLVDKFAKEEERDILKSAYQDNPALFKFMANVSAQFQEDSLAGVAESAAQGKEDAATEYYAMFNDRKHPLHDANHPNHAQAQARHMALYKKMNSIRG